MKRTIYRQTTYEKDLKTSRKDFSTIKDINVLKRNREMGRRGGDAI